MGSTLPKGVIAAKWAAWGILDRAEYAALILALTLDPVKLLGVRQDTFVGGTLGWFVRGSIWRSLFELKRLVVLSGVLLLLSCG